MPLTNRIVWRIALAASLAVLTFGVWFQVSLSRHWTRPAELPYGVNNPVLAMQLAKPPWPEAIVEPGENMAEMSRQQYIDFGYIPSYAALFLCIGLLQRASERRWISVLGTISMVLILIAACYDVAENFAILGVTREHNPAAWASIRPRALVKWACAFLTILLQAPFYATVKLPTARGVLAGVLGGAAIAAGLPGFLSSVTGNERGIGLATLPLLVSMLVMPVFLWRGSRAGG
ncbi:MAG TPA: hypothetical protein VKR61_18810 [Bryobacteraceae bacterium]|nr:hypothetical protein [Bryobacteraceae bacterium]